MLIQWTEINDNGDVVTHEHPYVKVKNAHTYAKSNHKACNGKGIQAYDNGWQYVVVENNGNQSLERVQINPRVYLCDCALRTIERAGF